MKSIFRQLANYKWQVILALVGVVIGTACEMILPMFLSQIVTLGQNLAPTGEILAVGGLMLALTLVSIIAGVGGGYFCSKVSALYARDVRKKVFYKVESFSLAELDTFGASSLITRTTNDVVQIQTFINMFLRFIIRAPIMAVMGSVLAYSTSPILSRPLLVSLPLILLIMVIVAKFIIPISSVMQKKIDAVNLVLREKLTGIRVIRAFVTENYEENRFEVVNKDLYSTNLKISRTMSGVMPILTLVMNVTAIFIVWSGAVQANAFGGVLVGDIIAVTQYVMFIMFSLVIMAMVFSLYPRATASAKRIDEVLATMPTIVDPVSPEYSSTQTATLEFRDVSFAYPNATEPALKNITFTAGIGETTAIIGSTGSGKTSILNLIPRLYDVTSGCVLVDGVDVRQYPLKVLREKIGFVPQRVSLFSGTIASNILSGKNDATTAQMESAATTAQAIEFISEKEDAFAAHVSQGGGNLSGGQKQRLSIARAVVREPEIYLFDDSFSALDFTTDARLRSALRAKTKTATVIIVAQRVSSVISANRILVMNDGQLVGNGRHDELIKTCDVYKEIVSSQFSKEEVGESE